MPQQGTQAAPSAQCVQVGHIPGRRLSGIWQRPGLTNTQRRHRKTKRQNSTHEIPARMPSTAIKKNGGGVRGGRRVGGVGPPPPTVPRVTISPNAPNKGAGSEASLPLTSRVRRRAPNLLIPTSMLCRAKWARPDSSACTQRTPKSTKEVSSCAPPPSPARPAKRTLPSR